jgi:hypothetical protein
MLNTVLYSEWIIKVANIAEELKTGLATAKNKSQQINAMRDADIKLQRADLEYATRAGSNNVHFLLARPKFDDGGIEYLTDCLSKGAPLNALGAYAWFHTSAIIKASGMQVPSRKMKNKIILSALLTKHLHCIFWKTCLHRDILPEHGVMPRCVKERTTIIMKRD